MARFPNKEKAIEAFLAKLEEVQEYYAERTGKVLTEEELAKQAGVAKGYFNNFKKGVRKDKGETKYINLVTYNLVLSRLELVKQIIKLESELSDKEEINAISGRITYLKKQRIARRRQDWIIGIASLILGCFLTALFLPLITGKETSTATISGFHDGTQIEQLIAFLESPVEGIDSITIATDFIQYGAITYPEHFARYWGALKKLTEQYPLSMYIPAKHARLEKMENDLRDKFSGHIEDFSTVVDNYLKLLEREESFDDVDKTPLQDIKVSLTAGNTDVVGLVEELIKVLGDAEEVLLADLQDDDKDLRLINRCYQYFPINIWCQHLGSDRRISMSFLHRSNELNLIPQIISSEKNANAIKFVDELLANYRNCRFMADGIFSAIEYIMDNSQERKLMSKDSAGPAYYLQRKWELRDTYDIKPNYNAKWAKTWTWATGFGEIEGFSVLENQTLDDNKTSTGRVITFQMERISIAEDKEGQFIVKRRPEQTFAFSRYLDYSSKLDPKLIQEAKSILNERHEGITYKCNPVTISKDSLMGQNLRLKFICTEPTSYGKTFQSVQVLYQ